MGVVLAFGALGVGLGLTRLFRGKAVQAAKVEGIKSAIEAVNIHRSALYARKGYLLPLTMASVEALDTLERDLLERTK